MNTTEESHKIVLLSIQIDKYKTLQEEKTLAPDTYLADPEAVCSRLCPEVGGPEEIRAQNLTQKLPDISRTIAPECSFCRPVLSAFLDEKMFEILSKFKPMGKSNKAHFKVVYYNHGIFCYKSITVQI